MRELRESCGQGISQRRWCGIRSPPATLSLHSVSGNSPAASQTRSLTWWYRSSAGTSAVTTVFHVSDLHFGRPAVPAQIEAIEQIIQDEKFDVVAISGDLSQRSRAGEFQRAAVFIRDAQKVSRTITVPGNHDVKWWRAPLGVGDRNKMYENYMKFISADLEPVLRVPGATFVGVNTSQGVTTRTLTWNVRDISIIGDLRTEQFDVAEET